LQYKLKAVTMKCGLSRFLPIPVAAATFHLYFKTYMMLFSGGIVCEVHNHALSMASVFGGSDLTLVGRETI
jgi:hypothetical protein